MSGQLTLEAVLCFEGSALAIRSDTRVSLDRQVQVVPGLLHLLSKLPAHKPVLADVRDLVWCSRPSSDALLSAKLVCSGAGPC